MSQPVSRRPEPPARLEQTGEDNASTLCRSPDVRPLPGHRPPGPRSLLQLSGAVRAMTMPPLRPRHRRQALAGLQAAVGPVARPSPLVLAWRWRYELILAAGMT